MEVTGRMMFNRYHTAPQKQNGGLRRVGLGLAIVGLAFLLGYSKLKDKLPDKIRTEAVARLNKELRPFGLSASIRRAEFFDGRGIRLTELRINDLNSRNHDALFEVHDVFVHSQVSLSDLVLGHAQIEAVDLRGGKVGLTRGAQGHWRLAELLKHLHAQCKSRPHDITIRLNDFSFQIVDLSGPSKRIQTIHDVKLVAEPILHERRRLIQIAGECSGLTVSRLQFTTFIDPEQQNWFASFEESNTQLNTELFTLLPNRTAAFLEDVQVLGGQLDLRGTASGSFRDPQSPQFDVTGQLRNFSLSDKRLPLSIKSCQIDFRATSEGFEIKRAFGQAGQGTFDISYRQQGLQTRTTWSAAGQLVDFNLTDDIHPWLPAGCKQFCRDFAPNGTSNLDFQISFDGKRYTKNMLADITNMEFNFHKFPYPFQQCRGQVTWIDDECKFDISSHIGRQPVRVSGIAHGMGSQATYMIDVKADGKFAIDEKLLAALDPYPPVQKQVLAFRSAGFVSCTGSVLKSKPDDEAALFSYDVLLHNCNVKHDAFQYPIGNVNGLIRIRNHDCSFENVTGTNGNAQVRCDGSWDANSGLELRFLCRQVPFDETLRNALTSNIQEIWHTIRPSGNIGFLRVEMALPAGANELDLVVDADLADEENIEINQVNGPLKSTVSIFPTWFPYEINELSGKIKIGRGIIELKNMYGKHRRTRIECQGSGSYSDQDWRVSLKNMLVGALQVDDDLLLALPQSLAQPLAILEFTGILSVHGEITVSGSQQTPSSVPNLSPSQIAQVNYQTLSRSDSTRMFWDLRLDLDQASLMLGLPVKNIFGMVRLAGAYNGVTASCAGELAIDSLSLLGAQITNVRGPIWIDERGTSAGKLAHRSHDTEPRQLIGEVCNGQVRFDARKQSDEDGTFFIQASVTDGCLQDLVNDFAPYAQNISGKCFGAVRFSGNETGTHSYRGEGILQLRDAQIYELPLVLSLLKILSIKEVNRTAFDLSNIDFTINGNDIELDRIELIGDAISLIGNGQINLDRQLDLNFYSVVGRNRFYIPLLSELYRAGSQSILWINVDGTLDQPNMHRNILPQLNDTVRTLLQAPERGFQFDNQFSPIQFHAPGNIPGGNAFRAGGETRR